MSMLIRSISGVRGITPNHLNDSIIKSYAQAFIPSFQMELSIAEETLDHREKTFYIYFIANSFYLVEMLLFVILFRLQLYNLW